MRERESAVDNASLKRTNEHWSAEGSWQIGRGLYWLELPSVQRRLRQKASGQADVDWPQYTLDAYYGGRLPLARCLSLGCGEGGLERSLASLGAFLDCDAYDIAEGSIRQAKQAAIEAGCPHIHYAVADINRLVLPARQYDAVWASGAVHHFSALEQIFGQVASALKPGGLFVLNEYIGANRFQFPDRQRQIIQACHDLLPARYRRLIAAADTVTPQDHRGAAWLAQRGVEKLQDGDLVPAIWRRLRREFASRLGGAPSKAEASLPTARSVQRVDPSEAVRSADIMPLLRRYFTVVEFKPLGGSILQFLLADIAGNFQDEVGEQLLHALFMTEDALMASGDLASDFAYIVATPRESA
jgi:2-polyprenyl-3-methyl-5-hydroxy-6-metoxy-1,4-benzoquinol methylase